MSAMLTPPPGQTGRRKHVLNPSGSSVRASVRWYVVLTNYQTCERDIISTRNSSVNEITACRNYVIVVKLYHPYTILN